MIYSYGILTVGVYPTADALSNPPAHRCLDRNSAPAASASGNVCKTPFLPRSPNRTRAGDCLLLRSHRFKKDVAALREGVGFSTAVENLVDK